MTLLVSHFSFMMTMHYCFRGDDVCSIVCWITFLVITVTGTVDSTSLCANSNGDTRIIKQADRLLLYCINLRFASETLNAV